MELLDWKELQKEEHAARGAQAITPQLQEANLQPTLQDANAQ